MIIYQAENNMVRFDVFVNDPVLLIHATGINSILRLPDFFGMQFPRPGIFDEAVNGCQCARKHRMRQTAHISKEFFGHDRLILETHRALSRLNSCDDLH